MIEVVNFSDQNSIYNSFLSQLRDLKVQQDRMRFRRNLERIGEVTAYEISKRLVYRNSEIISPLGVSEMSLIENTPVLATILRAGLPLHQGVLNYFDTADNCFISAYRKHSSAEDFEVEIEYLSSPSIEGREVILCDPMLASGSSMLLAYKALLSKGTPSHIHVVTVIASDTGVEHVRANMPENTTIWVGAIDNEMTSQSYIVPGLGDAGDLSFGIKTEED